MGLSYAFFLPQNRSEADDVLHALAARAALVVTDEYPVPAARQEEAAFFATASFPFAMVDHNGILPMRSMPKEQYSAKFFRDRAHRLFEQHWCEVPDRSPQPASFAGSLPFDSWDGNEVDAAVSSCDVDHSVFRVPTRGGRDSGLAMLEDFLLRRLDGYAATRNREASRTSGLSPYLHFGFLGIHEVARAILFSGAPDEDIDAFLEEAIIRRELSFNMCFYRNDVDSFSALPDWSQKTLDAHRRDRRSPQYSFQQLEKAETYDDVWNLAQRGLVATGTIHTYLRMLWGKKILEWSESPEAAIAAMLALHDRYAIDGGDPNTYAGVLWCLGKHDRPWAPERPIFGSIRYMSSESTRKKVDLKAYAAVVEAAVPSQASLPGL
jgi:deoxyribodipyrimidine photo-lyase